MMRLYRWLGAFLFLLVWVSQAVSPSHTTAQGTVTWGQPFNVSESLTGSNHPTIVADTYGNVHVFWSEDMNGPEVQSDELSNPGNTIMYRRWDGQSWTEPSDIIAVPDDVMAEFVSATVDDTNQLHLVWTGLTKLYYSTAPASDAYSIRAWSTPQVIAPDSARSAWESDVAVDSQGNVHVVYATRGSSTDVFHIMRAPTNANWSTPVRVSDFLRENETAFKDVRLVIDAADRLHATWSTANTNGYSQAVYYARSEQVGELWQPATMLADATINTGFTGFPSLLAQGGDELLLIYVDEGNKGRIERTSTDAGRTWSEPRFILPGMEGVNGFLIPLVDGGDNLHLVINMRPSADQRTGIYYAPRAGLDWAPIIPVATDEPFGPSAHYADAVVRLGNEIHVVWNQIRRGEIWHVQGTINDLTPLPAQTPSPRPDATPIPTPTTGLTSTSAIQSSTPQSNLSGSLPMELTDPPVRSASSLMPILVAIFPVLLLVGGVILMQAKRKR